MDYVELSFSVLPKDPGSEILITKLAELGFDSFIETEQGFCAYISETDFSESLLQSDVVNWSSEIQMSFTKKIIKSQNWNKKWEEKYSPVIVANKCCIRAPFHDLPQSVVYDIVIEPKMSFGTGHHETTSLMIERMFSIDFKNKSVLDVGCGTGVLAILAGKMEASKVVAIDTDEWAYANTIENSSRNGIKNIVVHQNDVSIIKEKFEVVLANINKNVLLADLKKYCKLLPVNGVLMMSGFFENDLAEIITEAEVHGMLYNSKSFKNNWVAAVFTKK